jgi:hypothetical protein
LFGLVDIGRAFQSAVQNRQQKAVERGHNQRRRVFNCRNVLCLQQSILDSQFTTIPVEKSHWNPFFVNEIETAHSDSFAS